MVAAILLAGAGMARASGPRWVTGPPYFTGAAGVPVGWYIWGPRYFTDPGDLSAWVNHASADALVAAAANVWNVPTSGLVIARGGALDEHVSALDAYLSAVGPVFPADVQSSNYGSKQIAVIYDSDGSVTDMLLGGGASSPTQCRQNGVTEDVDSILPYGAITHAIVILNGRCTGPAPEQQLQMQYQLQRAFGRVLGLGWSQTNDNVFTGTPSPTPNQAMHWPIMHAIDIVCGLYTYQCQPKPFTLRDDDLSSISALYPMVAMYGEPSAPPAPGKIWSYHQASQVYGSVSFPTGEGMQGVNVVLQRRQGGEASPEPWYDVSVVSGATFQQDAGNPVTGTNSDMLVSMGSADGRLQGSYTMGWIPNIDPDGSYNGPMLAVVSTEAINPLYIGAHSVGPYRTGSVTPSGSLPGFLTQYALQPYFYPWSGVPAWLSPANAANNCNTGGDGIESAPLAVAPGGWWSGVLCAHGHSAWSSFTTKAGRTATVEVTALDEGGLATIAKTMPLIGIWAANDAQGTMPTLSATPSAFNSMTLGMTSSAVATATAQGLRFVVADSRGDGRPDFAYRARVLYADSIAPVATSVNGGLITITGMGFRAGNQVTVNGVPAVVSSWTATTIVAVAPLASRFPTRPAGAVDVAVVDLSTGGKTVMTAALSYGSVSPDVMTLVSAPSGTVATGTPATVPFAVRITLADGINPVVGLPVTFAASGAALQWGACAASPCVVLTDATGLASTSVTPSVFGIVTLQASAVGVVVTASFTALTQSITPLRTSEYVACDKTVAWTTQVNVTENGAPASGMMVDWTAPVGITLSAGSSAVSALGVAEMQTTIGPLAAGIQALGQACASGGAGGPGGSKGIAMCAAFSAVGVAPSAWSLTLVSGAGQTVGLNGTFAPVVLLVTDGDGHPVAGAPVAIHQTVDAAEMPCPLRGRCPVAPLLGGSNTAAISDVDGLVTVAPMQIPGVGEVTNLAVATGTQGFLSLSLQQGP